MPNQHFRFKQFVVQQDRCAMKVTTDSCLFGAWCASVIAGIQPQPARLLDIGAGTGLLSLMVAQQLSSSIAAIEIDAQAATQARQNIAASPWTRNIEVVQGDVQSFTPSHRYNCIISNPPFYEVDLKSPDEKRNIAHHGDSLRLTDLLRYAARLLTDDGMFFLLLPAKRKEPVMKLVTGAGWHLHHVVDVHQSPTHQPFRVMLQVGRLPAPAAQTKAITIRDDAGEYHPDFVALLKDCYLYL